VDAATPSTMMLPSRVQGLYMPSSMVVVMEVTAAATKAAEPSAGATNRRSDGVTCGAVALGRVLVLLLLTQHQMMRSCQGGQASHCPLVVYATKMSTLAAGQASG